MPFKITTFQKNTFTTTVMLSGILNTDSAPKLDHEIQQLLAGGTKMIILDLAKLMLITSTGIGIMTKAKVSLSKRGGDLAMINLQPQIKKVFEIVRLLPVLNVFENAEELDRYLIAVQNKITEED